MGLLEMARPQMTAEDDARRVRMALAQSVMNIERGLQQVAMLTRQRGRRQIDAALGKDATQLPVVYNQLRQCLAALKPDAQVPELPQ